MKTHEHALISLGYAVSVALMADRGGTGISYLWVIVAALIGGEVIDLVDHPLYHLVYNRNNPNVVEARKILRGKGLKAAWSYLNEAEADRKFKGLLLHNIFALSVLALVSIIISFVVPGSIYVYIALGAYYLHMLTDVFGDFKILGHIDNWFWVIPDSLIEFFGKKGRHLYSIVMAWNYFIQLGFILITFRWAWQISHKQVYWGLAHDISLYSTLDVK